METMCLASATDKFKHKIKNKINTGQQTLWKVVCSSFLAHFVCVSLSHLEEEDGVSWHRLKDGMAGKSLGLPQHREQKPRLARLQSGVKLYQCPWQSTEVNVAGFLITAVTLHDSPETVLGRDSVLEFGLGMYFSCSPKFQLNILVGQSENMNLWDYLIPRL